MVQEIIVSLFDYTGIMVAPWAEAGFLCYCVDLRNSGGERGEGNINGPMNSDLHSALKTQVICDFKSGSTRFAQVRLQHGKEQFTEGLHVSPSSFTTSRCQT